MTTSDIVLVNMPFGPLETPSLALSTIKAILTGDGLACRVRYANIEFASLIGQTPYFCISSGLPRAHDLAGEYIFSRALFGDQSTRVGGYLNYLNSIGGRSITQQCSLDENFLYIVNLLKENIAGYCDLAVDFVERVAGELAGSGARIVGFTSAFQQNCASLAVAQRIRRLCPDMKILFGGANCEGEMGRFLFSKFPFIDAMCIGEAEPILLPTVHYLLGDGPPPVSAGGLTREAAGDPNSRPHEMANLTSLPLPDYSDFFEPSNAIEPPFSAKLLFETSRGCWWGEKHHCTFCGLNGTTMRFRQKGEEQVLSQLASLSAQYPGLTIVMTDNIIDYRYFSTVLPALSKLNLGLDLFYEVKANLKREQLAVLASAGVKRIQPGIESLSDNVLALMDKGINGLQNIRLLRWCREYGIEPAWNLLWGFPGERARDYEEMALLIPKLAHLTPPIGFGRLRLDRFSPYFEDSAGLFDNVRPFEAYSLVYPWEGQELESVAYFFDGDLIETGDIGLVKYTEPVRDEVVKWKTNGGAGLCFMIDIADMCLVFDSRWEAGHVEPFTGLERSLLLAGDRVASVDEVSGKAGISRTRCEEAAGTLERRGFIHRSGDLFVTLPIFMSPNYPGLEVMRSMSFAEAYAEVA